VPACLAIRESRNLVRRGFFRNLRARPMHCLHPNFRSSTGPQQMRRALLSTVFALSSLPRGSMKEDHVVDSTCKNKLKNGALCMVTFFTGGRKFRAYYYNFMHKMSVMHALSALNSYTGLKRAYTWHFNAIKSRHLVPFP